MTQHCPPVSIASGTARRRWLQGACAGAAAACIPTPLTAWRAAPRAPNDRCVVESPFSQPLPAMGSGQARGRLKLGGDLIELRAEHVGDTIAYVTDTATGRFVNPTFVATPGALARIALANRLREPTIAHWHGLQVDSRNDGNGDTLIAPGARFDYAFAIRNRAGLYWYHPHPHGLTASQTYRGLFGLIEVTDDDEHALRRALDLAIGSTELTLILQDQRLDMPTRYAPGANDELFGWFGDAPQVNGVLRPYHDVASRRYRLRLVNASNARTYRLAFRRDDGSPLPFALIGTDGGLLGSALPGEQVFLSPAERIDLLVDFTGMANGDFVLLESRAFDPMHNVATNQIAAVDSAEPAHGHGPATRQAARGTLADGAPFALLQFRVRTRGGPGLPTPATLSRMPALPGASGDERTFRLGFAKARWRINDRVHDMQGAPIDVARGASEVWVLRNYHTSAPHAMHLHGFAFRVLERETSPGQLAPLIVDDKGRIATDLGVKDTVLVWPGESVRIAIDFRHPFDGAQSYLLHCHNLEHEDGGMMLRVRVG